MSFLTWGNEADAIESLNRINSFLECPVVSKNKYRMEKWAQVDKSYTHERWGFQKPPFIDVSDILVSGFEETEGLPEGWFAPY